MVMLLGLLDHPFAYATTGWPDRVRIGPHAYELAFETVTFGKGEQIERRLRSHLLRDGKPYRKLPGLSANVGARILPWPYVGRLVAVRDTYTAPEKRRMWLYRLDGNGLHGPMVSLPLHLMAGPVYRDLNGDGRPEMLFGTGDDFSYPHRAKPSTHFRAYRVDRHGQMRFWKLVPNVGRRFVADAIGKQMVVEEVYDGQISIRRFGSTIYELIRIQQTWEIGGERLFPRLLRNGRPYRDLLSPENNYIRTAFVKWPFLGELIAVRGSAGQTDFTSYYRLDKFGLHGPMITIKLGNPGGPVFRDLDGDGRPEMIFDNFNAYGNLDYRAGTGPKLPNAHLEYKVDRRGQMRFWKKISSHERLPDRTRL